jgi:hypothetical protein
MTPLEKATLTVEYSSGAKDVFKVQYNPTEFTLDKGVQFAEIAIPGLDSPLLQFVRGQCEKLSVELFFDTTDEGAGAEAKSVTKYTDPIYALTKIEPSGHAPPIVTFSWNTAFPGADLPSAAGNQRRNDFRGVVDSCRQKFNYFSPEGVPLRATLTLSLREYKTLDQQLLQLNLSSPDRTHAHLVRDGETLARVAAAYYGRPADWRHIADKNGVDDPRRLDPGVLLTVPSIR